MPIHHPWEGSEFGPINTLKLAARGREVLHRFSKRGLTIPAGNRIEAAARAVEDWNAGSLRTSEGGPDVQEILPAAIQTLWDALVIEFAATRRPHRPFPFPNSALTYLLQGARTPAEDRNPKARNTQFELYAGSALILGGAEIRWEEPDLRVEYHRESVGVAAKRVTSRSASTMRNRVREAVGQLISNGVRGFVALDVSAWLQDMDTTNTEAVGRSFSAAAESAHRALEEASRKDAVLGALLFGHKGALGYDETGEPRISWHRPLQMIAFAETAAEEERAREFLDPLYARFMNSLREIQVLVTNERG